MDNKESNYVGKWNKHKQCHVIRKDEAHLPHASYRYYDGGIYLGGIVAVQPSETMEQAVRRVAKPFKCYADTLTWGEEPLFEEYPQ